MNLIKKLRHICKQQKTIILNIYRTGVDYYIYFVSQNATGFRGDLAVDAVQIIESE